MNELSHLVYTILAIGLVLIFIGVLFCVVDKLKENYFSDIYPDLDDKALSKWPEWTRKIQFDCIGYVILIIGMASLIGCMLILTIF